MKNFNYRFLCWDSHTDNDNKKYYVMRIGTFYNNLILFNYNNEKFKITGSIKLKRVKTWSQKAATLKIWFYSKTHKLNGEYYVRLLQKRIK